MDQDLFEKVRKLVAEELNIDEEEIKPGSNFRDNLGADSLALVELVMAFEEKFEIENIPDEDMEGIRTVEDAVNYIGMRKETKR